MVNKKLLLSVLFSTAVLTGCSDETKKDLPIHKIENAEVVGKELAKFSGKIVIDDDKKVLELSYDTRYFKFEKGKKYDVYYQGEHVEGVKEIKELN